MDPPPAKPRNVGPSQWVLSSGRRPTTQSPVHCSSQLSEGSGLLISKCDQDVPVRHRNNVLRMHLNRALMFCCQGGEICADRDGLLFVLHHRSHRGRSSQVHRHTLQKTGQRPVFLFFTWGQVLNPRGEL
jgi:hypothetical protein